MPALNSAACSALPQIGSPFEDWLKVEGIHAELTTASIKRVLARQFEQAMKEGKITKSAMAKRIETSRPQLDRLLVPDNGNVTSIPLLPGRPPG